MPLKHDGNYRGPHASHVSRSSKLGKHKTVITAAMPLIDSLLSNEQVSKIHFGRVVNNGTFTPRSECKVSGQKIRTLLAAHDCAQTFTIEVKSAEAAGKVAEAIKTRWTNLIGGGPHLIVT